MIFKNLFSMNFLKKFHRFYLLPLRLRFRGYLQIKPLILWQWYRRKKCSVPAPNIIKHQILLRHGIKLANWIETGTFVGETTKLLSKHFPGVFTIEASEECQKIAKRHLGNRSNISFYSGTSEDLFESIIKKQKGKINIFLDAHYSGGITFKGSNLASIKKELSDISNNISKFDQIAVFIDDIDAYYFDPKSYPKIDYYAEWARNNKLDWIIECNIFIAKTRFNKAELCIK